MANLAQAKKSLETPAGKRQLRIYAAGVDFWTYCTVKAPDFYTPDRLYLKDICDQLQDFADSDDEVLVLNAPPRHGKSRTISLFTSWILGRKPTLKVMTGSYNEMLSTTFSKSVRDTIQEVKANPETVVFSDIFPGVEIKRGDAAMNLWSLKDGHNNYLATSPTGTATGFGADCFPAGTMIATPYGEYPIETICSENIRQTLSLSHDSGRIEVGKIVASRRKIAHEFTRVTTENGREIESTSDHRFYTEERGYVRASELKQGETFKTLPGGVFGMRATENRARREVFGMLQQRTQSDGEAEMPQLREGLRNPTIRKEQAGRARGERDILHRQMFVPIPGKGTKETGMPDMQGLPAARAGVLLSPMQGAGEDKCQKAKRYILSVLQRFVHTEIKKNCILFKKLRKQSALKKNDRGREFPFQGRYKLYKGVPRRPYLDTGTRQLPLSEMRGNGEDERNETIQQSFKPPYSPHGPQPAEQRLHKFDHTMRDVSYPSPQNEKIAKVETISKEEFVYDIQVDEHHNFFANGILVHNCIIIDDLIKSSLEANTDTVLEAHWSWYANTLLSRLEEGGKIIIVMTRWSTKDLAGKVLEWCKAEGKRYRHISYKAHQGGGKMLCPQILSYKSYLSKASAMSRETVRANYDQEPMDVRGKLYGEFKTYTTLPVDAHGQSLLQDIRSYTDTADEGDDYLCQMIYGVHDKYAYILDIYYTKDPMETTEEECARRLAEWRARTAVIESNNGGRGFARQVKAHLARSTWQGTEVRTFTQRRNKKARIISNATTVMQRILMPTGWQSRWPEYYDAMAQYQREGTNAHDDAPDTTTGVVEDLLGISGTTTQEDRYKAVKALGL